jgi:urea carboxylase
VFRKVLVASRGASAARIIRTLRKMGIASVAVYTELDRHSLHTHSADEAILIGPPAGSAVLEAARKSGADAIHPGDGFLSENADFAQACADDGRVFIGPAPEQIRAFRLKHAARKIARDCGVPILPGSGVLSGAAEAAHAAELVGYPVMLKCSAGRNGIGMQLCRTPEELLDSYAAAEALGQARFGSRTLYLEKFIASARHIEVQLFGDGRGTVVTLGERDGSPQRRYRQVIEEAPAPGLGSVIRERMFAAAIQLGRAVGYQSAGTVEFIFDKTTKDFYFLEFSAGLQPGFAVTEEVTGIDLVEWMIRQAAGELPELSRMPLRHTGSSIEVQVYAENPARNFQPSSGRLTQVVWPGEARVETWVEPGTEVTPASDSRLAQLIVHGENRATALARLREALAECALAGIETNLAFLRQVTADPGFAAGGVTTSYLEALGYERSAIEVIESGAQTTVQDYPGRLGYRHAGVPPSGPMDALAFRVANRLVGNPDSAAAFEIAISGPTLRFTSDTFIAVTGADFAARLDGRRVPLWRSFAVPAGALLEFSAAVSGGGRAYLAVAGGLGATDNDVPEYLESRATFVIGGLGGHSGRTLRAGDVLSLVDDERLSRIERELPPELIPQYAAAWEIGVLYGPHGAPGFFAPADIEMFFSAVWKMDSQSGRTGVRLIGPEPLRALRNGGETGFDRADIHDSAYAVGSVDFTGNAPFLVGPDGPTLIGFVSPATIVQAELWKMGQLKPGDLIRFRALSTEQAAAMEEQLEACIADLAGSLPRLPQTAAREEPVLAFRRESHEGAPAMVCRAQGDRHLLIEYGPNALDLKLRIRLHALEERLRAAVLPGILDITPGVRCLQIHYDRRVLSRDHLLEAVDACEDEIPDIRTLVLPSRIVHLPLSWDDPAFRPATGRTNGLSSLDDVRRIVHQATYLVLAMGGAYLGGPVAAAIDPQHRLVTTPNALARERTPEGAVGFGGHYLRVYGTEGSGRDQLVGRTLQMWNTFGTTAEFQPGAPWLLRCFDQIRFFPVSAGELIEIRDAFPYGRYPLRIEHRQFRLDDVAAASEPAMPEGFQAVQLPAVSKP